MAEHLPHHIWSGRFPDSRVVFDGLTEDYDLYRPHYAESALRHVRDFAGEAKTIVDVASGTGILTRALRQHFPMAVLIGAEPGQDMLVEAATKTPSDLAIAWLGCRAEALPFASRSVDLITVGQAAHWFERPVFYGECARALRSGGVLAFLYNDRVRDSPVAEAHETALEEIAPGYWRGYRDFSVADELAAKASVSDVQTFSDAWTWDRTLDQFLGYVRSTSHFKVAMRERPEPELLAMLNAALTPLLDANGLLHVPYKTNVTLARFG